MSNLANVEVLDSCPQCGGEIILFADEWVCSNCGLRLLRWFDPDRPLQERAEEFSIEVMSAIARSKDGTRPKASNSAAFLADAEWVLPLRTRNPGRPTSFPPRIFDVPPEETDLRDGKVWWDPKPNRDAVLEDPDEKESLSPPGSACYVQAPSLPAPPLIITERPFNPLLQFVILPWEWVQVFKELKQKVRRVEAR